MAGRSLPSHAEQTLANSSQCFATHYTSSSSCSLYKPDLVGATPLQHSRLRIRSEDGWVEEDTRPGVHKSGHKERMAPEKECLQFRCTALS